MQNAQPFVEQLRIPRIENRHIRCAAQRCGRCKPRRAKRDVKQEIKLLESIAA
jgi:hypothetical protein